MGAHVAHSKEFKICLTTKVATIAEFPLKDVVVVVLPQKQHTWLVGNQLLEPIFSLSTTVIYSLIFSPKRGGKPQNHIAATMLVTPVHPSNNRSCTN